MCHGTLQLRAEEVPVSLADTWCVPYMRRLFEQWLHHYDSGNTDKEKRVQGLLDSLVTN